MKKPSGGRPSLEAAAAIESRIVAVARGLFFAHGYGTTSVETIARMAGISKRTFYHRFENKAAIFRAVVNELVRGITPQDIDALFKGKSIAGILQHIARAMITAALMPDTLALQRLMIAEATRFPELALVMSAQGARQDTIARIAALLEMENKAGRLKIANPEMAAEMFLQLIIGAPQRRALGLGAKMDAGELAVWVEAAVMLFLHGCGAPAKLQPIGL